MDRTSFDALCHRLIDGMPLQGDGAVIVQETIRRGQDRAQLLKTLEAAQWTLAARDQKLNVLQQDIALLERRLVACENANTAPTRGELPILLVVHDDKDHTRSMSRVLGKAFWVEVSHSAQEALERVARGPEVHAVLADVHLPDGSGADFVDQLASIAPALARRTVFLTGFPDGPEFKALSERAPGRVLAKPVAVLDLEARLAALLG